MSKSNTLSGVTAVFVLILASTSANAQATRTWVSGVGDDVNPCSRTAPCKTFAGALAKTAAGGQISTLDAGGFGAVTITKSVSITNDNAGEAGILAGGGGSGVTINVAATDFVNLRGLVIDAGTSAMPGTIGVRVISSGTVTIANSVIRNFVAGSAVGVNFAPTGSAKLTIRDTHIIRNGAGAAGGAIVVKPTGGTSSVTLTRVTMDNNSNGLVVDTSTSAGAVFTTMLDSSASVNSNTGVALIGNGGAVQSFLVMQRSASSSNANGVTSTGSDSNVQISNSVVTGNNTGLTAASSGKLVSYGNNVFDGNLSKGAVTSTVTTE